MLIVCDLVNIDSSDGSGAERKSHKDYYQNKIEAEQLISQQSN
jgi:hypothetical protein